MSTNRTADDLADLQVQDENGANHRLGDAWRDRTAVLAFVRHFGWLFCREQVVQLHRRIDDIHAAGAELVVIGNGTPNFVAGFRETTGYGGPLFVDPSLEAYKRAGMKRSVTSVLNPKSALHAMRALRHGSRQGRIQGDNWQQGGTLVITPAGDIKYSYHSSEAGDHAPTDDILAALRD